MERKPERIHRYEKATASKPASSATPAPKTLAKHPRKILERSKSSSLLLTPPVTPESSPEHQVFEHQSRSTGSKARYTKKTDKAAQPTADAKPTRRRQLSYSELEATTSKSQDLDGSLAHQKPPIKTQDWEGMKSKIKTNLKQMYSVCDKTPLFFFEKVDHPMKDCLQTIVRDPKGEFHRHYIQLEDIFASTDKINRSPGDSSSINPRILLEGQPGFGKTTLASQLCSDFSSNKDYISQSFEFVFLVHLRYLNGRIEEFLTSQLAIPEINAQTLQQVFKRIQRDTLLILDGFDELRNSAKNYLYPILEGSKYPYMHVLLTSRPGLGLIKNYLSEFHSDKNFSIPWSKIILMRGIAEEQQQQFLRKNLSEAHVDSISKKIAEEMNEDMKEIYKCPLFLQLLAVLIKNYNLPFVTSKTDLYKRVFTIIVTQSLHRENLVHDTTNLDLFKHEADNKEFYHKLLVCLGELALDGLRNRRFFFDKHTILKHCKQDERVFKLGLLTKSETFQRDNDHEYYEPIHKSFLEFLAGFYLSTLSATDNSERTFVSKISELMEDEIRPMNGSLFYQFLGGILGEKTELLFKAVSPWSFKYIATRYRDYSYDSYHVFYPIWCILREVDITDAILNSLLAFVPVKWEIKKQKDATNFFTSALHAQLLRIGTENDRIQLLTWHIDQPIHLPKEMTIKRLELDAWKFFEESYQSLLGKIVHCEELTCRFVLGFQESCWSSFLNLLTSIRMKKLNFVIDSDVVNSVIPSLYEELTNGMWRNININRMCCCFVENKHVEDLTLLRYLIQQNRITGGLQVKIERAANDSSRCRIENKNIKDLFDAVGASKVLREFNFVNLWSGLNVDIDFRHMCNSDKTWTFFAIQNLINFKLDTNRPQRFSVHQIEFDRINKIQDDLKLLSSCSGIRRLTCRSELLNALERLSPNVWSGFDTIVELNLKIADETYRRGHFRGLGLLKKLETLSLDLYWVKSDLGDYDDGNSTSDDGKKESTLNANDAENFASIMPQIPLKRLEFFDVGGWNVPFVKRVVEHFLEMQMIKEHRKTTRSKSLPGIHPQFTNKPNPKTIRPVFKLEVLKIQFYDILKDDMSEFLELFKKYLQIKVARKICFVDPDENQIKQIVNAFRFKDGFQISLGVHGLDSEDSMKIKKSFVYNDETVEQLSISLCNRELNY